MQRVSNKPSTYVEFAGIDDVDVQIVDASYCYFNYSPDNPTFSLTDPEPGSDTFGLCLAVQMQEAGKEMGRPQAYSAGDKEFFKPSPDGAYLLATGTKQALNDSTNTALFLASICNVGFPEANLDTEEGVKTLRGVVCHVNQMKRPEKPGRSSLMRTPAPGKKAFDPNKTILLVTRIVSMPGQAIPTQPAVMIPTSAPKPQTAFPFGANVPAPPAVTPPTGTFPATAPSAIPMGASAAVSPSNGAASDAAVALAQETLFNILAENGGKLNKKQLPPLAFKALGANPLKAQVVPLIFDDKFLSGCPGIRFDGASVEIG